MIDVTQNDGLLTVTLNRPEKANSLTSEMLNTLCETVETTQERGVKALVLTGAGKVFSAGADLEEAHAGLATSPLWERLSAAIANLPCLTVAALNGTVAGGANGMVLACDFRLAVPGARFFYPVAALGFLPQPSDPARMRALIGPARTKLILLAGQKIDADTALAWGLVDQISEPPEFGAALAAMTSVALEAESAHLGKIKAMVP